ncbi:MAG: hypothetical protein M0P71_13770 [Melioribacteraceae bacterium]|nr:hypothetical protein [Melioribacteraceae bacterium]
MAEFSKFEEENIILLALESPEFFHRIASFMKPEYFVSDEAQYLMKVYCECYEKYSEVPTREMVKNMVYKDLSVDDPISKPIIEIIDRELDPRNAPFIKDHIIKWAKQKQISMLYDDSVMEKIKNGDFESIEKIFDDASKISDVIIKPFNFFKDVDQLFEVQERDYFTCGFPRIDREIHDKGPCRREVLAWVAPTGVGKSILLVNTSIANTIMGRNVLHISLENDERVTGNRYLGAFTNSPIRTRFDKKDLIKEQIRKIKTSTESELFILFFPTDTVSVDAIEIAIKDLNKHYNFIPDVLCVDYLECLLSKTNSKNKDDYTRQKAVAAEFRALIAKTNTFGITASQSNRSSVGGSEPINVDKLAESYGKAMPLDYILSINQNNEEYTGNNRDGQSQSHVGRFRLFMAKNRNGRKGFTVNASVNYATMKVVEDAVSA